MRTVQRLLLRVGSARELLTKCVSEIEKEVVPTPRGMLASSAELDAGHDRTLHTYSGRLWGEVRWYLGLATA